MVQPEHPWFRTRGYLHFDKPISLKKTLRLVTDPSKVAKHSFLPFITFDVKSYKISQDKITKKITKDEKERKIAYSSHVDSHIYAYYAAILSGIYEEKLKDYGISNNVIAFRALNKSNIEFANEAFNSIKNRKECGAVALDLSKFFDTLDHLQLKDAWCRLLGTEELPEDHYAVFKNITRYSAVYKNKLYEHLKISKNNPKFKRFSICSFDDFRNNVRKSKLITQNKSGYGIPQGSPISALLSNIYMLNFDIDMKNYVNSVGGDYYRYCDDMLFIVPLDQIDKVAGIAERELFKLKVKLNVKKTELRSFTSTSERITADKPLQYLGFLFDGHNIYLRSSSLSRYSDRMRRGVRLAKATMKSKNKTRVAKGLVKKSLFKEKIYARYAHVGKRNFLTYGYRAARIMESSTIRKQLKPLLQRLKNEIEK
ncbi:reverse transcriptase domain-containing protein [Yersinia ruckeri]|uniref:antiviral reverse transcriptase Drt2 n=1 Tax=Yersinia ruckeri TaxID=29486 RepID=UPI00226446FC|nr:antiviral reverse transcriptase Drt2 [Yersinia ruckeri]UZX56248.1 reverse transcriptase domain-containing protein [Yersinia ruckeri]